MKAFDLPDVSAPVLPAAGPGAGFLRRLLRRPAAVVALAVLLIIIVACVAAPILAPYGPNAQSLLTIEKGPSLSHLLGTDDLGRDVLSRLLYGGRVSLLGVLEALVVLSIVGVGLGLVAGYFRGWADKVIGRIVDLVMALPTIIVVLAVLAMFGNKMGWAMVTFGLLGSAGLIRVVRAATLAVRNELYVAAAQVSGVSRRSIVLRHILPRVAGPVIVQLSLFAGVALAVQAGLAFLSLGIVPPNPSWGGMVADASQLIDQDGWLLVPSGGIIAITILALGILGDAVRDATVEAWTPSAAAKPRKAATPAPSAAGATAVPAPPAEGALLSVRELRVDFPAASRAAVDGISFDIAPGEIVGLVGESGSGKTMTALALIDLLPSGGRPSGSARFDGTELVGRKCERPKIGIVWQEPMNSLDPAFRIGNQLDEVVRRHRKDLSGSAVRARSVELLRMVQLPDPDAVARRYPHELSGGMAQRVVIALALAGEPRLLVADEPTTALDVTVQAEILDLLRSLQETQGMAVLLVTHNLAVVADLCSRAMVMQRGQIVESATVEKLFDDPQHQYTRTLLAATPSLLDAAVVIPDGVPPTEVLK